MAPLSVPAPRPLYWRLQLLGWGLYGVFGMALFAAFAKDLGPYLVWIQVTIVLTLFGLSHGLRYLIKRFGWEQLPLLALLGRRPSDADRPPVWNHLMHYATGATLGALRGVWAATGLRGPRADLAHTAVRLAFDQTLENGTGVGAPPHTWPLGEQVVDVAHKAVYSVATGVIADRLVAASLESRRGTSSH